MYDGTPENKRRRGSCTCTLHIEHIEHCTLRAKKEKKKKKEEEGWSVAGRYRVYTSWICYMVAFCMFILHVWLFDIHAVLFVWT